MSSEHRLRLSTHMFARAAVLWLAVGLTALGAATPSPALAHEGDPAFDEGAEDLSDLSIEDLSNVLVTVPSKAGETISESPAIVSSVSMEDLRVFGVRTLKDALEHVPNVLVAETTVGATSVSIRGLSETFNQKVLFLLDGVPYWMSSHGDIPLLGMPAEMISRLEVVRGPGSVLYGTNASAGIINVVLKKNADASAATVAGGSHGLMRFDVNTSRALPSGTAYVGASVQRMRTGYDAYFPETVLIPPFSSGSQQVEGELYPFPTSGDITKREEYFNVVAGLETNGLRLMAHTFESTHNGLGGAPVVFQPNDYVQRSYLLHADYTRMAGPVELNAAVDHNPYFLELDIKNFLALSDKDTGVVTADAGKQQFDEPWSKNYRTRMSLSGRSSVSENSTLLFGVERERRSSGTYVKTDANDAVLANQSKETSVEELSLYGQLDGSWSKLRTVVGVRYVDNELAGSHVAPRLSFVYPINRTQSLKLLFAEGFNSPVISQQDLLIPFVIEGNPNLKAEIIRSVDLAYTMSHSTTFFVANLFYLEMDDVISRATPEGGSTPRYINTSGFSRYGAELDFQATADRWKLLTNFGYNHQGDQQLSDDPLVYYVPRFHGSMGVRYSVAQDHTLGLSQRFYSARDGVDSQFLTTVAYTYDQPTYGVFLNIVNLLDEEHVDPDMNQGRVPVVPGGPGRSLVAGVNYYF